MKIKNLLFGMLASVALVGCSNDDEPVVNNGNEGKGDSYVAISIVAPGGSSSRATEGEYEVGVGKENEANSALFVFFNRDNQFVEAKSLNLNWDSKTSNSPQVEKISEAVLVLDENAASTHSKVVAILNTDLMPSQVSGKSLSQICDLADDYSSTESFVMSSTVYFDATGVKKIASDLTAANFATSEDLAKKAPVEVYVERVLARVDAMAANVEVEGEDVVLDQDQNVTLTAKILGYKLYSTSEESYLIKNIANKVDAYTWSWNDAANKRSYWATIPADMDYDVAISYNGIEDFTGAKYQEYVQENTGAKTNDIATDRATKLLVKAKLQKAVNGGTPVDAGTIIQYKGMYFTEDGFLALVNSSLQGYTYEKTVDEGTLVSNDWTNYIKIVKSGAEDAKAWEIAVVLDVNEEKPFPGTDAVKLQMEEALSNLGTAWCWNEGAAYFYVDIEHFGTGDEAIGIVRNHIYQLTISKIKGLGTPVYDPNEIIIPEKTPVEPSSYVAARINILKWKLVKQNVTLE